MKNKFLRSLVTSLALSVSGMANAGIIPYGIQTDLTQTTIENWGWTECSRSSSTQTLAYSFVESSCTGDLMMMAAWDVSLGLYGIAAAGETSVITTNTFIDYHDDSRYSVLDNWSNGVNFYRTSGQGSWGFTSIDSVALSSADTNLRNGFDGSSNGTSTTEISLGIAAIGLSWHTNGGSLTTGWSYNPTGYDMRYLYGFGNQRVFFTMNSSDIPDIPEPSTLAIFALGLMGLISRRFNKKA